MQLTVSEKTKINRKVKIKHSAHIFGGEIGIASLVTNNLYFYVSLERDGFEAGLYFDYDELEFIDGR
jgi:hypothetical protein